MPLCLVLHDICIIPACSYNHSCLSSLLCLRPSFPCYPKAPQVQDVCSPPLLSSCPGFLPQVFVGRKRFFLWYLFVCQAGLTPPEQQQLLPGHCPGECSQEGEGGSRPHFPKLLHTKDFRRLEKLLYSFAKPLLLLFEVYVVY